MKTQQTLKLNSKTWRILHVGEQVDIGDMCTSKMNNPDPSIEPDSGLCGWIPNEYDQLVLKDDPCWYATKIK